MSELPNPNGCRFCGVDRETHLQRWAPGVEWHRWAVPTDEQRKARLLARREAVTGAPHRIDVTHVAPGELERMARSGARPSPELRAAIDQARDRKGPDRG